MKILLIYHPYCLEDRLHEEDVSAAPIGLYYVGAFLKENRYDVEILNWHNINRTPEGIQYFPESEPLNMCLGISSMNLGEYDKALLYLKKFQASEEALHYITKCYKELGDTENESVFLNKLRSLQSQPE